MSNRRSDDWTRRKLVRTAALAGTGFLAGLGCDSRAAEPTLETTRLRMVQFASTCFAPQYLAEDLLRAEASAKSNTLKRLRGNLRTVR